MWKLVVTSSNNNLLLKIYCKNIVKILWQYFSIRIFYFLYYFSSFHFIFIPTRFISFFSFFFFLFFSSTQVSSPPSFIFFFTSRTFQRFTSERERERERERSAWASTACISTAARRPPHRSAWVRSAFFFFFFFLIFCFFY